MNYLEDNKRKESESESRQLPQVKSFKIVDYQDIDESVNNYIVEIFNRTRNFPKIKVSSTHIFVICNRLVETKRLR